MVLTGIPFFWFMNLVRILIHKDDTALYFEEKFQRKQFLGMQNYNVYLYSTQIYASQNTCYYQYLLPPHVTYHYNPGVPVVAKNNEYCEY